MSSLISDLISEASVSDQPQQPLFCDTFKNGEGLSRFIFTDDFTSDESGKDGAKDTDEIVEENGPSKGVAGHMARSGYGETFFPFVVGHGSLELTAIVLSGAAGLKLGGALLSPGQYSRLTALRLASREAAVIVYGAGLMLVVAAALEAFWSSQAALPAIVKYSVGGALWFMTLAYLFSGYLRRLTWKSTS